MLTRSVLNHQNLNFKRLDFKLEMKKMWSFSRKNPRRNESIRPLIENNNNNIQDGNDQAGSGYDNPSTQNIFDTHKEQSLKSAEKLAELLGVTPDASTSEDESCQSMRPETNSGQQNLIQRYVSKHLQEPPADLDKNLQQHLFKMQETVRNELVRLGPRLDSGKMDVLIDCYHHQIFDHLNDLLKNTRSAQSSLVLMKWVLHIYLSEELLGHPDLQDMYSIKKVDLLLFTKWVEKAKDTLLENGQKEVRGFLEKILQIEKDQETRDHEEAFVRLYMDTILCIDAMPKEAQKISSKLSDDIREVCFQELLMFLGRYTTQQTEILEKKAKMDKPETIHFFKTLRTCEELKQHVQTKGINIERSLVQEIVSTIENMEACTLKLLMEIVAGIAESHLKNYFKMENKQFFDLIWEIKIYFPKLLYCQEVQKRVMDEAYKLIAHIYLKHLVRSSQSKRTKHLSPNVGQTITEDAKLLHSAISELAPGVQQWNRMLLKIAELLECSSIEAEKLTVAIMLNECLTWSEDLALLPALLQLKGLSRRHIRDVLDILPEQQPRPKSASWYCCLTCW